MDLPGNVVIKHQTYWFIKTWPSRVKSVAPTAKFRLNLGIKKGVAATVIRKAALEATIEHCQIKVDPGANFNKWLKTMKGMEGITGRSLRHGVQNAFVMTGQNNGIMKSALGWSGGDQTLAMHYGASGVGQSKFVRALQKAFKEAHAATIKALA